uniref:Uncharacterized protein LOC111113940 n=1 Tax=Crassostrea virginica TaxID=6565 RepID=A0A8B8BYM7_CRAVI|nr:uncharacterized protein LOC111113940 [Crassostrea virginica]
MDELKELRDYGTSIGLKDANLTKFITEQQAIQTDERHAQRELEKIKVNSQAEIEKERLNVELEREKLKADLERIKIERSSESHEETRVKGHVSSKIPKLPVFDDTRDEMDSFLLRFERCAEAQHWDKSDWALSLCALIRGKVLDVFALMPKTEALDYNVLKTALLRRYELTDDGFKKKFRSCRPEQCETFSQFSVRLSTYFDRWIDMTKTPRTFHGLYDLMLRDQFLHVASQDLKLFLKERLPDNINKMSQLADQYKDARDMSAPQATNKGKTSFSKKVDQGKKPDPQVGENKSKFDNRNRFIPKSERNVPDAKPANQPDPEWQVHAVETRQQKRAKDKPYPQLEVPSLIVQDVDPVIMREAQEHDTSLAKVRSYAQDNVTQVKKNGNVSWFKKNGLLFRQYITQGGDQEKVYSQLVVPSKFRDMVMKLAHDSLLAGHLGTQRTIGRVSSEFYWPGIQSDVRRFCQSCDICQRTVHKGKVGKVPLERMPLIDEPFQRVAVDLVGPLFPATGKGNRYILTLVDYATRYPEAIALPNIETERVAEALIEIFSRIGVPREMLTDMGTQFTSSLMSEVSRLISLRQLTTTPYHPSCNGLVERFNGTLKQILKRLCAEKPKDWDKYLSAVLFAYREVPQESVGFSPFELVYGRSVRGPITILKELWTKDVPDPNVKTTYQYVLDLKERLQSMAELAKVSLEKSSTRYKKCYDRKTRNRTIKAGEKALVLLPTDNNKLLLQWKGPYVVTKRSNRVDYQLDVKGKLKTFHINLMKKYTERSYSDVATVLNDDVLGLVNASVVDCDDEGGQDGQLEEYPVLKVGSKAVAINPLLSSENKEQLLALLNRYADVLQDKPGTTDVLEHDIRTVSDKPVHVKNRQIPYSLEETVNKEVNDMLQMNIIEHSDSPYCSPVVIVPKKDGTNRFCIDFRLLSNQTVFDSEPMPDANEMFSKLAGHRCFSKIDLSKGYWQVKLTDTSRPKTAFRTGKGLFQFMVMPFGLVTAPVTFSRLMRKVLHGMSNVDNFIDDILVYTETLEHHFSILEQLFQRLRKAGLTAKPSKCSLGFNTIDCLGHMIGNEQLKPDSDKVEVIRNAPRPQTKKQLRSVLGLIGFYRKFVPNFAQIAAPLTDLTKKGCPTKLVWNQSHDLAFQSLKCSLTQFPILKLPNIKEVFILLTDASDRGLGAVLMQMEQGQILPIAYASRKLKECECKYATVEKECLAIVWAIQKFQQYLYGHEFILETDHSPLVYLNKSKVTNPRLMRWALSLQPYRFRIIAIKGKDNVGADYLSRL